MSGGTNKLTGRQFQTVHSFLNRPCKKRKASERMLYGKMRNRIERILRQEEEEGLYVFKKLKPTFKLLYIKGEPAIGQDGKQAKYLEYDAETLKAPLADFKFDTLERAALLELLVDAVEEETALGDEAAGCLQIAAWFNMAGAFEARLIAAHEINGFSGELDAPHVGNSDEE